MPSTEGKEVILSHQSPKRACDWLLAPVDAVLLLLAGNHKIASPGQSSELHHAVPDRRRFDSQLEHY